MNIMLDVAVAVMQLTPALLLVAGASKLLSPEPLAAFLVRLFNVPGFGRPSPMH